MGLYLNNHEGYPKAQIAKALGFSRSNFYHQSKLEGKDKELVKKIEYWHRIDDTLGYKKLAVLAQTSKNRVRRVMKKYGLSARWKKKRYRHHSKSSTTYPNLANDEDRAKPYQDIFFSDIFEFKIGEGVSLSTLRGCFALRKQTRQVNSLVFSHGIASNLVQVTLGRITKLKSGAYIWHSDQGRQYGAKATEAQAKKLGMDLSMSRAGTPTDNPFAERFVRTFKHAVCNRRKYQTLGEFLKAAGEWIDFYNKLRPHEGIGNISPNNRAVELGVEKVFRIRPFCV
ncbi:MAG: IS3 family transposase [bacterium]